MKLLAVWGPFRCSACRKQRRDWEGRCFWDEEAGTRTGVCCIACWDKREKASK